MSDLWDGVEPRTVSVDEENVELIDMKRRFWVAVALSLPLLILGMSEFVPGDSLRTFLGARVATWVSFVLATPVVLWGGLLELSGLADLVLD